MTGRIKNSTEKTSFVVFKYDFCKSRNLSSIEGTLPLDFLEMSSPEKYQECQTGFEKVMDSLLKSKKMTLVESRKNEEDVIHDNRILGFREGVAVLDVCADKKEFYWSNFKETSNPQPIGFSGILLAKRQNSFYCTYFLHNRNVADTKSPYPIKRLEVIRCFNQKSMVFNQSLS